MRVLSVRSGLAWWGTALLLLPIVVRVAAQEGGAPDAEGAHATPSTDGEAELVRALIAGSLDVHVAPQTLFDVPLDDEAALRVEAARVRLLLQTVDELVRPPEPARRGTVRRKERHDAGLASAELAGLDGERWTARLALDRARLAFYDLDPGRRAELLGIHAARQEQARERETDEQRRARESEEERARALEAARVAQTESKRMVSEEVARLIALETKIRGVREGFEGVRSDIVSRREAVLGWQRRVRDAKFSTPTQADATYDALRRALRVARDDLSSAIDGVNDEQSRVPSLGANPLVDVPPDGATDKAQERRAAVERAIQEARREERALRRDRASALIVEIDTLNRERLDLLAHLSPDKRGAITGFTAEGWDQARSEARHLSLILRYHAIFARTEWHRLRTGAEGTVTPWATAAVMVPLLAVAIAFSWLRRGARPLLQALDARLYKSDRAERRSQLGLGRRAVRVLLKIHRTLEWIVLFVVVQWLLPARARELLEVQLLASIIGWSLASTLIVNTIDACADVSGSTLVSIDKTDAGRLRLRSLRLVGRTIVVFALILSLSARLVGEGTIHSWVFSTCWFAGLPVFLLLVRWWRGTVFERLDRLRKKTPLQAWILANRLGWRSFLAAMLGAIQLFGAGTIKVIRGWIANIELARRVHAYLFKRELERMGEGTERARLVGLSEEALAQLHPERPWRRWLPCPADRVVESLARAAEARRGRLVAVIGARGMGKSSLLRAVAARTNATYVSCTAETGLSDLRVAMDASDGSGQRVILLDDAHTIVRLSIGGIAPFDELIAFARGDGNHLTWLFAIDAAVWPFLRRARDARPMFDEIHLLAPWNEVQLEALIVDRCEDAALVPTYDDLLEALPPGADEVDRQDALRAKRAGYARMLWDHVGGNPGLALEVWRVSLAQDERGGVHVRPLQVPNIATLERLSDVSLFILRAVLQLAPTTAEAVAHAARLRPEEVLQDFRFGKTQGFYDEQAGLVRIAWPWLRAVTRLLERRRLLVSP